MTKFMRGVFITLLFVVLITAPVVVHSNNSIRTEIGISSMCGLECTTSDGHVWRLTSGSYIPNGTIVEAKFDNRFTEEVTDDYFLGMVPVK